MSLVREVLVQRSRTAFVAIVRRHERLVLATAYRILRDRAGAGDVAQEVFLGFLREGERA